MKIVHICLACFFVEGMGYQENLLPANHVAMGHQVYVLTSDYAFNSKGEQIKKNKDKYENDDGVQVEILDAANGKGLFSRFKIYKDLFESLERISPDIIFVHGLQFLSYKDVLKYVKRNPNVKLYADNHADYYNTPVEKFTSQLVHRYLFGRNIRKSIKYVSKFWGVTPWRCDYLHDVYKIPKEKIHLLTMGGDDRKINFDNKVIIRDRIRKALSINDDDFVIISGGKIDESKNIHLLLEAVRSINIDKIKVVVFGQPTDSFKEKIEVLVKHPSVRYVGWIPSDEAYNYFLSSDLCVFPGTHSVLWEQACACGLPGLYKKWPGMCHVSIDGSGCFLEKNTSKELQEKILYMYENKETYQNMKNSAEKHKGEFFYSNIAKKAIDLG